MKACKLLNVTHYFFIRQVGEGLKYYRTMDRFSFLQYRYDKTLWMYGPMNYM